MAINLLLEKINSCLVNTGRDVVCSSILRSSETISFLEDLHKNDEKQSEELKEKIGNINPKLDTIKQIRNEIEKWEHETSISRRLIESKREEISSLENELDSTKNDLHKANQMNCHQSPMVIQACIEKKENLKNKIKEIEEKLNSEKSKQSTFHSCLNREQKELADAKSQLYQQQNEDTLNNQKSLLETQLSQTKGKINEVEKDIVEIQKYLGIKETTNYQGEGLNIQDQAAQDEAKLSGEINLAPDNHVEL